MRILLITDEVWNDNVFGNNVLTNWFTDMPDIEIAEICSTPGKPFNRICNNYFQLTDMMALKSLISKRAGRSFETSWDEMSRQPQTRNYISESRFYSFMKRASQFNIVPLLREFLWKISRIDKKALKQFIDKFNPDIVFCPRRLSWKLMKIEKVVHSLTDAPFIAFTGDDEASFREVSYSPLFWINRFLFHNAFNRHVKIYSHYFTGSKEQAEEYNAQYHLPTSSLYKSCEPPENIIDKPIGNPIRIVYAGHIYCNRWKSLASIGEALRELNKNGEKAILEIYTQDELTNEQRGALNERNFIYVKGRVDSRQLKGIYRKSDIALHVESFDKKYRLLTRTSFSTKIIDLLSSTCAVIAICWDRQSGYNYLKENDAAICIPDKDKILETLRSIIDNPSIIAEYSNKAAICAKRNHDKEKIQDQIISTFNSIINK